MEVMTVSMVWFGAKSHQQYPPEGNMFPDFKINGKSFLKADLQFLFGFQLLYSFLKVLKSVAIGWGRQLI